LAPSRAVVVVGGGSFFDFLVTTNSREHYNKRRRMLQQLLARVMKSWKTFVFTTAVMVLSSSMMMSVTGYHCSPYISKAEIVGIWRLKAKKSLLPKFLQEDTESSQTKQKKGGRSSHHVDIVLKLNEDGSFANFAEDTESGSVFGVGVLEGSWDFQDSKLVLAAARPSDTDGRRVHDTIFVGELATATRESLQENPALLEQEEEESSSSGGSSEESSSAEQPPPPQEPSSSTIRKNNNNNRNPKDTTTTMLSDVFLSIPNGKVRIGKFVYPKRHPSFFEQPMLFQPTDVGEFELQQVLGLLNTKKKQGQEGDENKKIAKYHKKDFYGRKFWLTTTPVDPIPMKLDHKTNNKKEEKEDYPYFDIRVMPIQFFANNTFIATGMNKVLRGHFGITGEERDRLWFQVSLFGIGRSIRGSVYSEGPGLSHEDRRGYAGAISELTSDDNKKDEEGKKDEDDTSALPQEPSSPPLIVQGHVVYGSDLAHSARSVLSTFVMKETTNIELFDDEEDDMDDDDDDDDDNIIGAFE